MSDVSCRACEELMDLILESSCDGASGYLTHYVYHCSNCGTVVIRETDERDEWIYPIAVKQKAGK